MTQLRENMTTNFQLSLSKQNANPFAHLDGEVVHGAGGGGGGGHAEQREPAGDRAQHERRDRGGAGEARAGRGQSEGAREASVAAAAQRRRGGGTGGDGGSAEAGEEWGGARGHRGGIGAVINNTGAAERVRVSEEWGVFCGAAAVGCSGVLSEREMRGGGGGCVAGAAGPRMRRVGRGCRQRSGLPLATSHAGP